MSDTPQRVSMSREQYRDEYLTSEHWRKIRLVALNAAKHRCQVCYSQTNIDVHHRTYDRLGAELTSDLTALCRRCHNLFHGALPQLGQKPTPAAKKASKNAKRKAGKRRKKAKQETLRESLAAMKERNGPIRMSDYGTAVAQAQPDNASVAD